MTGTRSRKRLTLFVFFLLVLVSLVVALWQYHQMVVSVYDGASASVYRRMLRPFSGQYDSLGQRPVRVALIGDAWSDDEQKSGEGLIRQWKKVLEDMGFGVRRIPTLRSATDLRDFNLLVVSGHVPLSDHEIEWIKDYVAEGNGVIMSWAAGTRNHEGEWRDPWLLRHLAGIDLDIPPGDEETDSCMTVMFNAQSPLATGIEPGHMLSLTRFDRPLTARVIESRTRVAGGCLERTALTWAERDTKSHLEPLSKRAAIVHGDYLAGRFVWMGFTIASGAPAPEQQAAFQTVIRNAVLWTTRQPMVVKPNWPEAVDSAFTLAWRIRRPEDVDDRLPALARAYRIPLTSYVTPEVLRENEDLVQSLADAGPVALLLSAGVLDPAGTPPTVSALRSWREQLAALNGDVPNGCSIGTDAGTAWLDRLAEAGYDYVTRLDSSHGLPRLLREYRRVPIFVRPHGLWELPDLPVEIGRGDSTALRELFDSAHQAGGLLHLSLAAGQIDNERLQALDELFMHIRRRRVWTAHAAEVLVFYRIWGHLRVSSDYPTPNRYVLQVSNTGTRPAKDFKVMIRLAAMQQSLEVTPTTLGTPPVHPVTEDGITWRFDISRIPAGKNFVYHVYRY